MSASANGVFSAPSSSTAAHGYSLISHSLARALRSLQLCRTTPAMLSGARGGTIAPLLLESSFACSSLPTDSSARLGALHVAGSLVAFCCRRRPGGAGGAWSRRPAGANDVSYYSEHPFCVAYVIINASSSLPLPLLWSVPQLAQISSLATPSPCPISSSPIGSTISTSGSTQCMTASFVFSPYASLRSSATLPWPRCPSIPLPSVCYGPSITSTLILLPTALSVYFLLPGDPSVDFTAPYALSLVGRAWLGQEELEHSTMHSTMYFAAQNDQGIRVPGMAFLVAFLLLPAALATILSRSLCGQSLSLHHMPAPAASVPAHRLRTRACILAVVLCNLPAVVAPVATRNTAALVAVPAIDTVALIAARSPQISRLASAIQGQGPATIAQAVYSCLHRDSARQVTGRFHQALTPASAIQLTTSLLSVVPAISSILWVGCGHGQEAITLALAATTNPVSIMAIDHVQVCIDNAHLLLRRAYMASTGCSAQDAAALDLTCPVSLGTSTIQFVLADAWNLVPSSDYDLIYSAAEQECDDDLQPISLLLQALAGGAAILAMYSSMWGKSHHRAAQSIEPVRVSIEKGSRMISLRDMRPYVMFAQPPQQSSRADLSPVGWISTSFGSESLHTEGRRVAVYFPDDNLWYGSIVARASSESVTIRFDDSHWPDLEVDSLESPPLLVLLCSDEHESASSSISAPIAPVQRAAAMRSSDGLYLSSSGTGYQGVVKLSRGKNPFEARIWSDRKWKRLGHFDTALAAAKAYAAARNAKVSAPITMAPSHCIIRHRFQAGKFQARIYRLGKYRTVGTYPSHSAAVCAYLEVVNSAVTDDVSPMQPVLGEVAHEYHGVRLHVSAASATGYRGVTQRGSRFRANSWKWIAKGSKRYVTIGTYATAIEAAHAYALYRGTPPLTLPPSHTSVATPADQTYPVYECPGPAPPPPPPPSLTAAQRWTQDFWADVAAAATTDALSVAHLG